MATIASLLAREAADAAREQRQRLLEFGFTPRELLGLDVPSAYKADVLRSVRTEKAELERYERERKRRKVAATSTPSLPVARPSRSREERRAKRAEVYNPWRFPNIDFVKALPALQQRNHYCIQLHHATAKHYDLRLLCTEAHRPGYCDVCAQHHQAGADGRVPGTISWAIPLGISGLKKGTHRLAVETILHGVHYSLHEGGGTGTTLVHDIGRYEIISSARSIRTGGRDKAADTDEETEDEDEHQSTLLGGRRGLNHERALGRAYRGYDDVDSTSFVIKLTGVRYNICLAFANAKEDYKLGRDIYTGSISKRKQWVMMLAIGDDGGVLLNEEADLGPASILTGRTMDELKAEGDLLTGADPTKCVAPDFELSEVVDDWTSSKPALDTQSRR